MPKLDGIGPEKKGSLTGRKLGNCSKDTDDDKSKNLGKGMGKRRKSGGGQGQGKRLQSGQ
jgi:hypothetical protein